MVCRKKDLSSEDHAEPHLGHRKQRPLNFLFSLSLLKALKDASGWLIFCVIIVKEVEV